MPHIAVIGAGITGVTTAYALAERGYEVTVLDRNRYAGMETSFANGGQLSVSNAEVWNSFATVLKGLKWMMRRDAPLLLNPSPNWHKYSWMAEFIANIGKYRENTIDTVRLALASREHMFRMAQEEGIEFDLERRGILHFYRDKEAFDTAGQVDVLYREGGLQRETLGPDDIRRIEPTLKGSYYGGFFTPSDSTGDIHKFTRGLAAACARRGVKFRYDSAIEAIEPASRGGYELRWLPVGHDDGDATIHDWEPINADGVVICAGCESRRIAASLGDRLNIYPVKGYSITVQLYNERSQEAAPYVSILDDATKIVSSRLGRDRFRVAGTAEFNGFNRDIRHDRIEPLIRWTREQFPDVQTDRVIAWSGLRPMMPSMLPRVGPGKRPGIFYNTGHGHLGWTLCAATAQGLAAAVESTLPADKAARAAA
ncbi:D-amino acid dehydrogenase [Enterovirga sp.]|uniref:D-amino acid dehydrogenase n=1 Tax=Enterovirga sp. TaxID=2026350 RepID=UPI002BFE021B|nr:D-amino acid dehydrogenase [Enterovirga sp.]HMO30047.1 D-amino acid dehydrogenase [Enterovirga sp.]